MKYRIFVAWLQLAKEKRRLLAAVGSIAFAVVLMLVQLGFKEALLKSAGLLPLHLTLLRILFVYVLTAFMCALSGVLAMGKLRSADPAEIF